MKKIFLFLTIYFFAPTLPVGSFATKNQNFYQSRNTSNSPLEFLFDFGIYCWALQKIHADKEDLSPTNLQTVSKKILQHKPKFPSLYLYLSYSFLYDYHMPSEAFIILQEANKLFPQSNEIATSLGYVRKKENYK